MTLAEDFTHLLSPLEIGQPGRALQVRNRVLVSAHVPGFAHNNQPGQQYIDYHQRYAKEGVGLQITGGTPVHESGLLSLRSDALWNLDDSVIPGYCKLADAVHAEGGRILAQLAHSGGTVKIDKPGVTSWSASNIRSSITGHVSHAMTPAQIEEVIDVHVAAAARVRKGGLDGVEILAAFGFLPQAFLSPLSNHRDDDYGGSLENRMRFLVRLLRAVRSELGARQILGVRLPGDEYEDGGLTLQTMKTVCKTLAQDGLTDYLNIIAHTNFTPTGRSKHWPPTPAPHGLFVDLAAAIKSEVSIPVFTVGRIVDPAHAERIIARGQADMVGMTRAHICDPTIVRKISNRQQHRIRPCVGANTCIANRYAGKAIRCMHNPELQAPGKMLQAALSVKNIAVIGAGPAGLEAARLCASRGHNVRLYEASNTLGGQLAQWASASSMTELNRIIQWRQSELARLDVRIETNQHIKSTDLMQMDADEIIIATGARDTRREFVGEHSIDLLTPMQFLANPPTGVARAIVVSDGRGQAGLVCAERLQEQGAAVDIVTEDIAVANDLDPTNRNAWHERLGRAGVLFTARSAIEQLQGNRVWVRNLFSQVSSPRNDIDLIIDWNGGHPQNELSAGVTAHLPIHSIGDCVSPRSVELAMAEALNVAQSV